MGTLRLAEFVDRNRAALLFRTESMAQGRYSVPAMRAGGAIAQFLDQLIDELNGVPRPNDVGASATGYGLRLYRQHVAIGEVVHAYGDVCQAITDLVIETGASISPDEFRLLNRVLDDAIASAVTEYALAQQSDDALNQSMVLRNLVETAITGFEALQIGAIGTDGSTAALVYRCLLGIRANLRAE